MGTPCVSWINEPERKSPPEVPGWLQDELHANPAFVAEAVEQCGDAVAKAYVTSASVEHYAVAVYMAVDRWVRECWETEEYNANAMSRKWARAAEKKA